jgi:hypothetical protein
MRQIVAPQRCIADNGKLGSTFAANTLGMGGMTQARMEKRSEPLRWPGPTLDHPGVSVLYLDHPSWYAAATALKGLPPGSPVGRFLTPCGSSRVRAARAAALATVHQWEEFGTSLRTSRRSK